MSEPIGDRLREARTARGLTLDEASEATKIRARYLRALEAEDWDAMPAPAYARGFLRTYAAYLGLDADSVVESYRRATEAASPEPALAAPEPAPPLASSGWRAGGVPWRVVGAAAVIAAIAFLFVLGIVGGGGGGGTSTQAGRGGHHHRHRHHRANKPPPQPTQASVQLRTTATVWVCLVDQTGKPLIDGEILPGGQARGPFRATAFELNIGNGSVELQADDRSFAVPASSSPLGYRITPSGVSPLDPSKRPTCT